MPRYEYSVWSILSPEVLDGGLQEFLNRKGEDGWRFMAIVNYPDCSYPKGINRRIILEREKKEEKPGGTSADKLGGGLGR